MADAIRDLFGLTQERMASWLGVNRTTVANAEAGRRSLPLGKGMQEVRLLMASQGKTWGPANQVLAIDGPPLPAPPLVRKPLERRLKECRYQALRLGQQLQAMQAKAAQFEARLAALPALRAYQGEVKNPAREAGWLALFEGEAVDGLRDDCGAGPQALLAARLAASEREAEVLTAALAAAPTATAAPPSDAAAGTAASG